MKRNYDLNMPSGKLTRVKNFLPPPGQLVFPKDLIKVTIALSKPSIEFFKKQAVKHHTKYQRMIREVVDRYAQQHAGVQ